MRHRTSIRIVIQLLGVLAMVAALPITGFGEVPQQINYQGALTDDFGDPLDGSYIIVFSIYAVDTGGTALWWEQQTVVVTDGIYNVQIGQDPTGNPFLNDLFDGQRWLGVKVGSDPEMIPRQPLTSVPFALMADKVSAGVVTATMLADDAVTADKIADSTITGDNIANGTITAFNIQDGEGSGLDADTLDGLDSSYFSPGANGYAYQLIENFTVAAGESVTAGDVVGFINGYVQKGEPSCGPEVVFNSASPHIVSAAALSATRFVVAYQDTGNSQYGTAVIGDVFGNTILYGFKKVFKSAQTWNLSVAVLSATKFVVAYSVGSGPWYGTAQVGTVSGNTISYGPEAVLTSETAAHISAVALSDTKFVVAYLDGGAVFDSRSRVGTVSGSSISYGPGVVFNDDSSTHVSAAALSATKFVVAYTDVDNFDYGTTQVGTVSGTTISYGSKVVFNGESSYHISAAALSATKFVLAYQDVGNSDYGTTQVGTVSGSSISYASEVVFNSASTAFPSAAALSATKFVLAYQDVGNSWYGTAVIASASHAYPIGIAREAKSGGEEVPVIIHGVSDVHNGLSPGSYYQGDLSGNLVLESTPHRIGLAISTTKILLD